MRPRTALIVERNDMPDMINFEVLDENRLRHVVQISRELLTVAPEGFTRGTDEEHLETLAKGAVLTEMNKDICFHQVSRGEVDRLYRAVALTSSTDNNGTQS